MRYYAVTIKDKNTGELQDSVRLVTEGEDPTRVLSGEELISCQEISEEQAIKLCGEEAIIGKEESEN